MYTFLAVVYVLVCFFLIAVVLLQSGKGGGLGSALGGGGGQTVFGGAGAGNFLTRLTAICAALFMVLSATLAYLSSGSEQSLERAAQDVAAREEARGAGGDGDSLEEAAPAGMSEAPGTADEEAATTAEEAAGGGDGAAAEASGDGEVPAEGEAPASPEDTDDQPAETSDEASEDAAEPAANDTDG